MTTRLNLTSTHTQTQKSKTTTHVVLFVDLERTIEQNSFVDLGPNLVRLDPGVVVMTMTMMMMVVVIVVLMIMLSTATAAAAAMDGTCRIDRLGAAGAYEDQED